MALKDLDDEGTLDYEECFFFRRRRNTGASDSAGCTQKTRTEYRLRSKRSHRASV